MTIAGQSDQEYRQHLKDWWLSIAAPLWLERGVDWHRTGYFDQLSLADARNVADFRRVRVCARQIFVFSRLHLYGVPRTRDALDHGLDCLLGPMRHPEGGFCQSITLDGAVKSSKRDLYDQAFVLFALAHAYGLTRCDGLVREARALFGLIEDRFRHRAGGFQEAYPAELPRRQNPHMHLLEACLAWTEAGLDGPWVALAGDLVRLMLDRFYSVDDGCIFEYFDDDLALTTAPDRQVFEPGHHFEWIHLLGQARAAGLCEDVSCVQRDLAMTALTRGLAESSGIPYGEVTRSGTVAEPKSRIWQVCEWLRTADQQGGPVGSTSQPAGLLIRMLDSPTPGLWRERWHAETGAFDDEACPASSLYHIMTGTESFALGGAAAHPSDAARAAGATQSVGVGL